jgi:hypothetical protein
MEPTRSKQLNSTRADTSARVTGIIIGVLGLLLMILGIAIAVDAVIQWIAPA